MFNWVLNTPLGKLLIFYSLDYYSRIYRTATYPERLGNRYTGLGAQITCQPRLFPFRNSEIVLFTVDSRYNEPQGEMENSSFYREFVILENLKIVFFSEILNSRLNLYLKLKERGEGEEKLRFE